MQRFKRPNASLRRFCRTVPRWCSTQATGPALAKNLDFSTVEPRIYQEWEASGHFEPQERAWAGGRPPFVMSMPPPNVTGSLHMGHAMFVSLQDLMTRYHRMRGEATLWLPGTDHAGIATQLQVEKQLRAEGSSREEVGREAFLKKAWAWKERHGGRIEEQMRRLGASCDWSRKKFTLDDDLCGAVQHAFAHLHEKGLIYRGYRLVNWSPHLQTAVSDLEVCAFAEPSQRRANHSGNQA